MLVRLDPGTMHEDKIRAKPEKFADHYTQARLFWASQKAVTDKAESAMGRFTAALVRHRVFERETDLPRV